MKIRLIQIGNTEDSRIIDLCSDYESRLKHYISFEQLSLNLRKKPSNIEKLKIQEGEAILSKIDQNAQLILLDEKGRSFDSEQFASFIQKRLNVGGREIVFLIGGAYGFSQPVYDRADFKIALSEMTFTHQMVRLIFIEQIYRAFTILKGEKYHH